MPASNYYYISILSFSKVMSGTAALRMDLRFCPMEGARYYLIS